MGAPSNSVDSAALEKADQCGWHMHATPIHMHKSATCNYSIKRESRGAQGMVSDIWVFTPKTHLVNIAKNSGCHLESRIS